MTLANVDEAKLLAAVASELQCSEKDLLKSGCVEDIRFLAKCSTRVPLPASHMILGDVFVDRVTGVQSTQPPLYPIFVRLATLSCSARKDPSQSGSLASLVRLARDEALLEAEQTFDSWIGPEVTQDGKEVFRSKTSGLETLTMPSAASLYIAYVANQVLGFNAFPVVAAEQAGSLNAAVDRVRSQLWVRQQATALVNFATADQDFYHQEALPPPPPVPHEYSYASAMGQAGQLELPPMLPLPEPASQWGTSQRQLSPPRGATPPPPQPHLPPPPAMTEVSQQQGQLRVVGRITPRGSTKISNSADQRPKATVKILASRDAALPRVPNAPEPPRAALKGHDKLASLADSHQVGQPAQPARVKAKVVATARPARPPSPVTQRNQPSPPPIYQPRSGQ